MLVAVISPAFRMLRTLYIVLVLKRVTHRAKQRATGRRSCNTIRLGTFFNRSGVYRCKRPSTRFLLLALN